jgi:hypothetical protein
VAILCLTIALIAFSEPPVEFYIAILVVVVTLIVAVIWHSRVTVYRCPACNEEFAVSVLVDFFSPHTPHRKLLSCPQCNVVSWCEAHRSAARPN